MSLSERIAAEKDAPVHGTPCSVGEVYRIVESKADELAALNSAMYELGWSQGRVWKELTDEGFTVGEQTVNKHRGKGCRCFKYAPFRFCSVCRYDLPSCRCDKQAAA